MTSLISARSLSEELANGFGAERDQILMEVGCGEPGREQHIPRSIWLDTNDVETGARCWRLVDDEALFSRLGRHGISSGSSVLISGDPLPAARVAWMLAYAGVRSIRILDGGFKAWLAARGAISDGWRAPQPVLFTGAIASELRATREQVAGMLSSRAIVLADVRSLAEYDGATSGYSYIRARGRIPGSVFARGGPNADHLEDYTLPDGRFAEVERVEAMWRELGAKVAVS